MILESSARVSESYNKIIHTKILEKSYRIMWNPMMNISHNYVVVMSMVLMNHEKTVNLLRIVADTEEGISYNYSAAAA